MSDVTQSSSGIFSQPDNKSDIEKSDISVSTVSTISSFKNFIANHVEPFKPSYSLFATSFLCKDVPYDSILCEDSASYKDVATFSEPVILDEFLIQENTRKIIGPSLRKPYIIPSTRWILNDLECKKFNNSHERIAYLYTKAQQWCEVNKALTMDRKYPKPNPNILRTRYSKTHQKACKLVREDCNVSTHDPITTPVPPEPFPNNFFTRVAHSKPKSDAIIYASYDAGQEIGETEKLKWDEWNGRVSQIFGDIEPIADLKNVQPHWQATAVESRKMKLKPKKKYFWKKNVYPPMTMEDHIRKKRSLLPPLKPEYLQTDYLSGIWKPELMINEFEITPLNYDSRLHEQEGPDSISWWIVHEATQKCWQWLHKIPSDL